MLLAGLLILSAGTYACRLAGQLLRARIRFPPRATRMLEAGALILLTALTAITALTPADAARPAGVAVAGLLAWRKVPFVLVVLAAAATTAVIRLLTGGNILLRTTMAE